MKYARAVAAPTRSLAMGATALGLLLTLAACGGEDASPAAPPIVQVPPTPTPTPTPPPVGSVEKPTGYYALTTRRMSDDLKRSLVSKPYISGMTSYVAWADIEPSKGQFDFSRIDNDIAIARAAGKKVTIGVFTGKDSLPSWLAADGVSLWTTSAGDTLINPVDARFVELWRERISLLGQRYDADPTVIQATMCGAAGTLCGPRYPELPAGVTYNQMLSNWQAVVAAYRNAFPNTYLNLEVHITVGFDLDLPKDIFGSIPLTANVGPFAEFLSDTSPAPSAPTGLAFANTASGRQFCGFQTVSPLGNLLDEAIALGRSYGCGYFEIYADDVESQGTFLSIP